MSQTAVRRPRRTTVTSSQINTLLAVSVCGAVATGLISWAVGTEWSRWWTALHAVFGVMLLVLTPAKARGSVKVGLRRRRASRWLSVLFGVVLITIVGLGFAHSTGVWTGVGYWTSLWTHFLLAFVAIPLLLWHMLARPSGTRSTDLDRRLFLRGASAGAVAVGAVAAVELGIGVLGTKGATRRFTGSHELASGDPDAMPVVSWIDDTAPSIERDRWNFEVDGVAVDLDELGRLATPLEAALDCTGGWWSSQNWDVVPIAALLGNEARSFRVRSATGYQRLFPMRDADRVFVAVGYGGRPLRRGHGAPLRLVAPGRRGPWWVKWVTAIESSDTPWWRQLPFPAT